VGGIRTEVGTITEGSEIQGSVNGISVRNTMDTGASRNEVIPEDTQLSDKGNLVIKGKAVPLQITKVGEKLLKEATQLRTDFGKYDFSNQIAHSRCFLEANNAHGKGNQGELMTGLGQSKAHKDVQHEKIVVLRSTRLSRQQTDPIGAYQEPLLDPIRDRSLQSSDLEPRHQDRELHQPDEEPSQLDEEPSQPDEELSRPDEEPSLLDKEPSLLDKEPSQSDEEPSLPDKKPSQSDEEPSLPDKEPSQPDVEPSQSDEEPSLPDEEPSQQDDETHQPHDKLHHLIIGSHHPDEALLQPDEESALSSHHPDRVWHTKDESHRLDWEPYDPGVKSYHQDEEPHQRYRELHWMDEGFGQQKRNK